MYKGGAVALVIKKSLNGGFLFSIFCIKLAVIFGSSGIMVGYPPTTPVFIQIRWHSTFG